MALATRYEVRQQYRTDVKFVVYSKEYANAYLRRAFQSHLENTLFHFAWIAKYLPVAFYESVFI